MTANLTLINEINNLATVSQYTFITKEGKPLTVTGELAKDLSVYYGMTAVGNKATFETAHRLRNITGMTAEDLKEKYNVDTGTEFATKYMGLQKGTISNYAKTAKFFFKVDAGEVRDEIFSAYNFSQLQELGVYIVKYMDTKHAEFEEAYEALKEIVAVDFPYTMSSAKIRSAIRKAYDVVDEPKATKAKKAKTGETTGETAGETVSSGENSPVMTYEDLMAYARLAKARCEDILADCFDEEGNYKGDDPVGHLRLTCEFIRDLFTVSPKTGSEEDSEEDSETEEN